MIHLFNPENDLALANNLDRFTLPKGAAAIRLAGTFLPMFWADKDDFILTQTVVDSAMSHYQSRYNLYGTASHTVPSGHSLAPWGWSRYTRSEFIRAGAEQSLLPDNATLESQRQLSHRRTAIAINRALGVDNSMMAVEATSIEQARDAVAQMGSAVIKLPWSSSGRGVIYSSQIAPENFNSYVGGMIAHQGSVTIEPRLNRLQDFAALFFSDGKRVEFRGLSVFATNNAGFYEGNIVEPQDLLARRIDADITDITKALEPILTQLVAPLYNGWLGIDMMTHSNKSGSMEIAPCVEMNLRMTMGVAAMLAAEKVFPIEKAPMLLKVDPTGVSLEAL